MPMISDDIIPIPWREGLPPDINKAETNSCSAFEVGGFNTRTSNTRQSKDFNTVSSKDNIKVTVHTLSQQASVKLAVGGALPHH